MANSGSIGAWQASANDVSLTAERVPSARCPRPARCAVRGIVFDMGDVLYDATVGRRWLLALLSRMGVAASYRDFFERWERDYLVDVHRGRREYGEALEAFLRSVGLSRGQIEEVLAASQAHRRELEAGTRPLPGVRATLEKLARRGLRLGVLTNSERSADRIRERLAAWDMAYCFTGVVSSVDLGRCKPDARCYQAALDQLELSAAETAFVGHDRAELAGAAAIGMRAWAFNHERGVNADRCLGRFCDLVHLVDESLAHAAKSTTPLRAEHARLRAA